MGSEGERLDTRTLATGPKVVNRAAAVGQIVRRRQEDALVDVSVDEGKGGKRCVRW